RQEPHERNEQDRGVQRLRLVVLGEDAPLVDTVFADVVVDLLGPRSPALHGIAVLAQLCEARAAVRRHPAHELRRGEVLGLATYLPDAPVRLAPALESGLHLLYEDRPHALRQEIARA